LKLPQVKKLEKVDRLLDPRVVLEEVSIEGEQRNPV